MQSLISKLLVVEGNEEGSQVSESAQKNGDIEVVKNQDDALQNVVQEGEHGQQKEYNVDNSDVVTRTRIWYLVTIILFE